MMKLRILATGLAMGLAAGCSDSPAVEAFEKRPSELVRAQRLLAGDEAPSSARFLDWALAYLEASELERQGLLAAGVELAAARRAELVAEIRHNPRRALELALSPTVKAALPPEVQGLVEERIDAVGALEVLGTLVQPGAALPPVERFARVGEQRFEAFTYGARLGLRSRPKVAMHGIALDGQLALSDSPVRLLEPGERFLDELLAPVPPCAAHASLGERTRLHLGDRIITLCSPDGTARVEQALVADEAEPPASAWTTGTKRLLYIRVDFADAPGDPNPNCSNNLSDVALHLNRSSYSKLTVQTTCPPQPFRMAQNKSVYEAQNAYQQLMNDARTAASNAGYNGGNYELDIVAFRSFSSWGWAGRGWVGMKGTWLNGSFGVHTTAHELGHNLGLYHANFWQAQDESIIGPGSSQEYGNPFEIMGGGSGHYNAWYKWDLDWILGNEVETVVASPSSNSYRIYDLEQPVTGGLHALRVPISGLKDYWVEFRAGDSSPYNKNGASINWGYGAADASDLLDMTPWTQGASDSPLLIGRTFSDFNKEIHLTPTGKGGTSPESLDVTVSVGPFVGNQPPTVTLAVAPGAQVQVGQQVTFTATAVDPNGDALAYFWDFGDAGNISTNAATQTKTWNQNREVNARVTVTDQKGGTATASAIVKVGSPSTLRISGRVTDASNGNGVEGVRVYSSSTSTWTDSQGNYALVGLSSGAFQMSARKLGWTVSPAGFQNPVTLSGASATNINFTASRATYNISGRVTSGGVGLPGVTVSAGTYSAVTNGTGSYTIAGVPNGTYALAAHGQGQQFLPQGFQNPVQVNGQHLTGMNFYEVVFDISGEVMGAAGPHTISDGTRSVQTVLNGGKWMYTLPRVPPGSWNLVARAAAGNPTPLTITPANFTNPVAVSSANVIGKDFNAVAGASYFVTGTVLDTGAPLKGVTVSDGTRSGISDSLGRYVLVGVTPGNYTLTPSRLAYTFNPATRSITVAAADVSGQDFDVLTGDRPPRFVIPARTRQNPVTGATAQLECMGDDDAGEVNLVYTWTMVFGPAPATFSRNATNGAKDVTVTFTRAGAYAFEVEVEDQGGQKAKSGVTLAVVQAPTVLTVSPATATVEVDASKQFVAAIADQFGTSVDYGGLAEWSVNGGGTITPVGRFDATTSGDWVVTAKNEGLTGTAAVKVVVGPVPRIARPPAATPNPVAGDMTQLSVLGADDEGEAKLTYKWSAVNPPGTVSFSANQTNAAKDSVATFGKEGSYVLQVEVTDERGLSVSGFVTVEVGRGLSRLDVTPVGAQVAPGGTLQFSAKGFDQTGAETALGAPAWSVSGGGSIDAASGLFTAGEGEGDFTVTAKVGLKTGSAAFKVSSSTGPSTPPPGKPGCGCAVADFSPWALAALWALLRRRS